MAANIDKNENVVVSLRGITKEYDLGEQKIKALDKVSLDINKGELITIQGPSGCGKTTLLNILSIMDSPTSGDVFIGGKKATGLSDGQQSEIRAKSFGYVFQFYNLINHLTALENVRLALDAAGNKDKKNRDEIATKVLTRVGLANRLNNKPDQLSGGEQQRVAIARALVNDPAIIIADEPTGDLDTETGREIIGILKELNEKEGRTILIVTHDLNVAAVGKRKILMRDYKIVSGAGDLAPAPLPTRPIVNEPSKKDEIAVDPQFIKIKELIEASERIKIQDIADVLGIKRKDVIAKLSPLARQLNFKINDDVLVISKDDSEALVDEIEKQFGKWGKDSKI
jgi:putative ABC transport system ATP-binding protein